MESSVGHPSNVPSLAELNVDMVESSEGRVVPVTVREQMPVCYDLAHIGRYKYVFSFHSFSEMEKKVIYAIYFNRIYQPSPGLRQGGGGPRCSGNPALQHGPLKQIPAAW